MQDKEQEYHEVSNELWNQSVIVNENQLEIEQEELDGENWFNNPENEAYKNFIETKAFATISVTVLLTILILALYLDKNRRDKKEFIRINTMQ